MEITEAVLRGREGDRDALKFLYKCTYDKNFEIALSYTHDEEMAKKILKIAYNKAFHNLDKLKTPAKFVPWMKKIVAIVATNELRSGVPSLPAEAANTEVSKENTDSYSAEDSEEISRHLLFATQYKKAMVACMIMAIVFVIGESVFAKATESGRKERVLAQFETQKTAAEDTSIDTVNTYDSYDTSIVNTGYTVQNTYESIPVNVVSSELEESNTNNVSTYTTFDIAIDEPVTPSFVSSESQGVLYKDILIYAQCNSEFEDDGFITDGIIARNLSTGEEMLLYANGATKGYANLELYGKDLYFRDESYTIYKLNVETGYVELLPAMGLLIKNSVDPSDYERGWWASSGFVILNDKLYLVACEEEADCEFVMSYDLNTGALQEEGEIYYYNYGSVGGANRGYSDSKLVALNGALYYRGISYDYDTVDEKAIAYIYSSYQQDDPFEGSAKIEDDSFIADYYLDELPGAIGTYSSAIYKIGTIQDDYQGYICLGKSLDGSSRVLTYRKGYYDETLLKQW